MANPKIVGLSDAAWIQVPADSTGKRIAHFAVDTQQSDGTTQTVYYPMFMQAGIAGDPVDTRFVDGDTAAMVTDRPTHHLLERIELLLIQLLEREQNNAG